MKILILTAEYPNPKSTFDTPVVHFYAKEWLKMGHSVRVIHYRSVFPSFFYFIARIFRTLIKKIFETDVIPFEKLQKAISYQLDGIEITTEPIFKLIPHIKYTGHVIKSKARQIVNENKSLGFTPDVIIGHFLNPQIQLFRELRPLYPNTKFSLVLHENPSEINRLFKKNAFSYLKNINHIGFRYHEMKNIFEKYYGSNYDTFICPSGVPQAYVLDNIPHGKFKSDCLSIAFVGMLIPLKNVDVILNALVSAFPEKNFSFKVIGEGMLKEKLESQILEYGIKNQVKMLGKKSRDVVQQELRDADVFVMVSKPEAFGLVYLEAMGKGCITIGTVKQGIDGVIQHGKNGYLCEAGSVESLKNIFIQIATMPYEEKIKISNNAMLTAQDMTDDKVAFDYLRKLNLA